MTVKKSAAATPAKPRAKATRGPGGTHTEAGKFAKGHTKLGGRKPGSKNKVSQSVRDAFKEAFDNLGGADALEKWARAPANRETFYKLASKLIPMELSGPNGGAIQLEATARTQLSDKIVSAVEALPVSTQGATGKPH